jgi:hypothetical protein
MTNDERQVSGDWLADIFDADDDDAITSLEIGEMPLPQETLAALEAAGRGSAGSKRSREEDEHQSTNQKKSRREKLRREALNDRFMELSALLDPTAVGPFKTEKATIVTEAAWVIKQLRAELAKLSATLEAMQESNLALKKETSCVAADKAALQQDKAKLQHQLYYFMSSMPFAAPPPGAVFASIPGACHSPRGASALVAQQNVNAVKLAPNHLAAGTMPFMWSLPPLVVQSTTAEEDARLRAPVA